MTGFNLTDARRRFFFLGVLGFLLILGIVGRLAYLQIVQGDKLSRYAAEQLRAKTVSRLPRGQILDRNGEVLAVSILTGTLIADPDNMEDHPDTKWKYRGRNVRREAADLLAPVLSMDAEELYKTFTDGSHFAYIKRSMESAEVDKVRRIIREHSLPGFYFIEENKRYYPKGKMAAQVLGFVGTDDEGGQDDKGLSGIEMQMDIVLKGAKAKRSWLEDAFGNEIIASDPASREGYGSASTVYLTLDSKIQYVLEDAMDDALKRTQAQGAAAIIMDPNTGEILGMTSRPTFDPNNFDDYSMSSWSNKAISMNYEPGSVFKPIVGCAGLAEGVITPDSIFYDAGRIKIADRVIHNWDDEGKGWIPFSEIIKFSINTGMVQLGMQLGGKIMTEYAQRFGFGAPTGIDLPGEESGILYDPDWMYDPDIATMAIGQGIAVTPIQVLRSICAIANGGQLLKPFVVKKIVAPNGDVMEENTRKVERYVLLPEIARQMSSMMEQVVKEGGGRAAAIKGYRIAGKTGTAEKLADGGGYAEGKYIASFVGFVPADKPRYAMLVILDTPKGAFYGSQVSAPIFRDTLQQILVAKGVQPVSSEGLPSFEEMSAQRAGATPLVKVRPKLKLLKDGKVELPDLTGISMRQAAELLQQGHLRLKPHGSGRAYKQLPKPQAVVEEGTTVEVWFTQEEEKRQAEKPENASAQGEGSDS